MNLVTNCGALVWGRLKILPKPLPPDCDILLCLNTVVRATGLKYRSDSIQLTSSSGSSHWALSWKAWWESDRTWVTGDIVPHELWLRERLTADKNSSELCYQFRWMTAKHHTIIMLYLSKSSAWYTFQILKWIPSDFVLKLRMVPLKRHTLLLPANTLHSPSC